MGIILPFQGYSSLLITSSLNTECGETTREMGCLSGLGFLRTCIGYILIVSKEQLLQSIELVELQLQITNNWWNEMVLCDICHRF